MCGPHGGPGGGPQRAKTMHISNIFFSRSRRRIVKLCSVQIPCQMKNKSCSWQFPGWPPMGPCGPFVKSKCFIFFLKMQWLDFNQKWQESSLGVGDSKLFKQYVWPPWGPRGRAPKGQNHANFKHLLLQIQKENSQVMQCVDTLLDEEQKLFIGSSQGGPNGPLWALCKK